MMAKLPFDEKKLNYFTVLYMYAASDALDTYQRTEDDRCESVCVCVCARVIRSSSKSISQNTRLSYESLSTTYAKYITALFSILFTSRLQTTDQIILSLGQTNNAFEVRQRIPSHRNGKQRSLSSSIAAT